MGEPADQRQPSIGSPWPDGTAGERAATARVEPRYAFGSNTAPEGGLVGTAFTQPFGHPDSTIEFAETATWSVRAASVRGRNNRSRNAPRREAYALGSCTDPEGRSYHALAVGGIADANDHSLEWTSTRTTAAVELVVEAVATSGPSIDWPALIEQLKHGLRVETASLAASAGDDTGIGIGSPVVDLPSQSRAASIVVALIAINAPSTIHGISIGRARVWRVAADFLERLIEDALILDHIRPLTGVEFRYSLAPGEAVLVVSDGLSDLIDDGRSPAANELAYHCQGPPDPFDFAALLDLASAGARDDRTAIGFWLQDVPAR